MIFQSPKPTDEMKKSIKNAFKNYCDKYRTILDPKSGFEPWANDKRYSIHETNQVLNFMAAYREKISENCLCWVEFSVPYKEEAKDKTIHNKTNHIDGLIIDGNKVILIEAKRLSRKDKIKELEDDLHNIIKLSKDNEAMSSLKKRLPKPKDCEKYEFYCILLADFWDYRSKNKKVSTDINWEEIIGNIKSGHETNIFDPGSAQEVYDNNYHLAYALIQLNKF